MVKCFSDSSKKDNNSFIKSKIDTVLDDIGIAVLSLSHKELTELEAFDAIQSIRPSTPVLKSDTGEEAEEIEEEEVDPHSYWAFNVIKFPVEPKVTGKGVKVGIIDSGIDTEVQNLNIKGGASMFEDLPWDKPTDPHGTEVASVIGGLGMENLTSGVAPEADIYAIRVSKGGWTDSVEFLKGLYWAGKNQMEIVNISLWDTGLQPPSPEDIAIFRKATQFVVDQGCLIVGIAGNGGANGEQVSFPGNTEEIMAVAGLDLFYTLTANTSHGSSSPNPLEGVEIVAPGIAVKTTTIGGETIWRNGTSYAAPFVSGAAALTLSANRDLSPSQVRKKLHESAFHPQGVEYDGDFGYGALDVKKLLGQ